MIREHLPTALRAEPAFRWRGGDVSRIEALSDVVFAFSLTLLVVSLEVPKTFGELLDAFRSLPVFAVCFLLLFYCWHSHFQFHRRFGFEDAYTIFLNTLLLFALLFYVYPLKFLFTTLFGLWGLAPLDLPEGVRSPIDGADMPTLMLLYSGGVVLVFTLFGLMNRHAWRKREELELDERERLITRSTIRSHDIMVGIGLASMGLAGSGLAAWAGIVYVVTGPVQWWNGMRTGRAVEAASG